MIQILRFVFIFMILLTIVQGLSGYRSNFRSSYNSPARRNNSTTKTAAKNASLSENTKVPEKPKLRTGISAWGIVALIISAILLCMGTYYSVLFYPLLCTKERKYDIIDLSPV